LTEKLKRFYTVTPTAVKNMSKTTVLDYIKFVPIYTVSVDQVSHLYNRLADYMSLLV